MAESKITMDRTPFIIKEIRVNCNGTNYSNVAAPSIDGYTPIGLIGYAAVGSFDAGKNIFQFYMSNGIINVGWSPALASSYAVLVRVLYLPS